MKPVLRRPNGYCRALRPMVILFFGLFCAASANADVRAAAFVWDEAHGMRDLQSVLTGDFGLNLSGWVLYEANAVATHDDLVTVVGRGFYQGDYHGWVATYDGDTATFTDLGLGFATDVTPDGQYVIGRNDSDGFEGYRWHSSGEVIELGMVGPNPIPASEPWGISDDGQVITGRTSTDSRFLAFIWTASNGMQAIGELPGGSVGSIGHDISADGQVIVGESPSSNGTEAFRWTEGEGLVGLGVAPWDDFSAAYAISGDGSLIVGQASSNGSRYDAAYWTPEERWIPITRDFAGAKPVT